MAPKRSRPASRRQFKHDSQKRIKSEKYIHVHWFLGTGRWGAWIREPKQGGKRIYLGTHLTDRLAARCQDRALLKLETDPSTSQPIKLNFDRKDYDEDEHLRNTLSRAEFFKLLRGESRAVYNKAPITECLRKFLELERVLENLPTSSKGFTLQCSVNENEYLTESVGESDDPTDLKGETSKEAGYNDNTREYEGSPNVVAQSATSFHGVQSTNSEATHDERSSADGEGFASVASSVMTCGTAFSWTGKRRRTSALLTSDEKAAIQGMKMLSFVLNSFASQSKL